MCHGMVDSGKVKLRPGRLSPAGGTLESMAISTEDLHAIAARARAQAAADGELAPKAGPVSWDLPQSIREAIWADVDSGAYEETAQAATAGDPEMTNP